MSRCPFYPILWISLCLRQQLPRRVVSGMMTIEVGPDLRLRIPGDVAVERAVALVQALRGAP